MKSECLNIKGLNVWYKKDKPVIKDTNLLVPNHSVVGLIGRNGAGKTTLLKALSSVFAWFDRLFWMTSQARPNML